MEQIQEYIAKMLSEGAFRFIISNPCGKSSEYKKIVAEQKKQSVQISKYTEKQVFHENISGSDFPLRASQLIFGFFRQINGFSAKGEHILLVSKKGMCKYSFKNSAFATAKGEQNHNRTKNYILSEGAPIPPLVDMGVFTSEGKVINSMYRKYKQINRFLETIDDELSTYPEKSINVIDFGCGKSYLTFVLYYYLTEIKGMSVNMIGLDLKEDVIEKCSLSAQRYGYTGLRFEKGDINGYAAPFKVDMVVTLHACDTATDYALYNAVNWGARYIFSVPCCQHQLNGQLAPRSLTLLSRYGIIGERFAALCTDAIRGNLLEYCGYKTQIMEFIDLDHTPKNILIRAVKRPTTPASVRKKAVAEIEALINEFGFMPELYKLIKPEIK